MTVKCRPYNREQDFDAVGDFLVKTYEHGGKYPNWLQPRWEYMHFHPNLNETHLVQIGIWEDDGYIVGVVNYEDNLGDAYLAVHPNYTYLKKEMVEYAEDHLSKILENGEKQLRIFINDFDKELIQITESKGFVKNNAYPEYREISMFTITHPFPEIQLPEGFKLKSLSEDNNLVKIDRALWRGFNHEGEPDGDLSGRIQMQSTPHYNKDLNIVVEAPNGDFVSYSGIWFDQVNKIGYIEPVATDPDYRRMGLGKAAVLECVRRVGELGGTVAFVESGQLFYKSIGFVKVFERYPWVKTF